MLDCARPRNWRTHNLTVDGHRALYVPELGPNGRNANLDVFLGPRAVLEIARVFGANGAVPIQGTRALEPASEAIATYLLKHASL
jgi:hypothetical protein